MSEIWVVHMQKWGGGDFRLQIYESAFENLAFRDQGAELDAEDGHLFVVLE